MVASSFPPQSLINSNSAGVAFTINPINQENNILIEAAWGLGETLVQGQVEPDRYIVDKQTGKILEKFVGKKHIERTRDLTGKTIKQNVPKNRIETQVLDDKHIITLAAYCKKIEDHYKFPQDLEWAVERNKIYLVQTRPVTTLKKIKEEAKPEIKEVEKPPSTEPILKGLSASPGVAGGIVRMLQSVKDIDNFATIALKFMIEIAAPITIIILLFGVAANIMQIGLVFSLKPLEPKINKLNPVERVKRLFSLRSVVELFKGILKGQTVCS